jgi:hypothetical protein
VALTNQTIGGAGIAGGTWTIQSTNTANIGRFHDLATMAEGAVNSNGFTTSRPGCFVGPADTGGLIPNCFAQAAAGGLSVNIRRGAAAVERSTLAGPYIVVTEATGTVTLGTADATNPRIDRIDLQIFDGVLGDNGGVSLTRFVVTQGTAAGVPAAAAAPANSVPIAIVTLPANTTTITGAMITDKRKGTAVRGAIRPLLPGDSLSDVGFNAGELRDTLPIGGSTIDRWEPLSGTWQLVQDLGASGGRYTKFIASQTVTTTTSTAYVNVLTGAVLCGHSFVAPPSGIVRIGWGINALGSNPGSSTVFVGVSVAVGATVGSGTTVLAANNDEAIQIGNNQNTPGYRTRYQTALTPGTTYNCWIMWRNSGAATASGFLPFIESFPVFR